MATDSSESDHSKANNSKSTKKSKEKKGRKYQSVNHDQAENNDNNATADQDSHQSTLTNKVYLIAIYELSVAIVTIDKYILFVQLHQFLMMDGTAESCIINHTIDALCR